MFHSVPACQNYVSLSLDYVVAPATCDSPHETHEANLMHLRRNIKVNHYALNEKGAPVLVTLLPQSLEGQNFERLKQ